MPVIIDGTNGITQAGEFNSDSSFGFKNRLINGQMTFDQRNAGASVTVASSRNYYLDRFTIFAQTGSKLTIQQNAGSVTPPVGFTNYAGITVSTAVSPLGAADQYMFEQQIEGYNVADLNFGSANAKTVTLSFWVRSSLTGTFAGVICNGAEDRTYPFTYTIASANTWTQASVTIAGDTTGTWLTTNGSGLRLKLNLGTGATYSGTANAWTSSPYITSVTGTVNLINTVNATWYVTGVQLEVGSTATSFDYRPYGTELALCQRYYETSFDIGTAPANAVNDNFEGVASFGTSDSQSFSFKVYKRVAPTMTYYSSTKVGSPTAGQWQFLNASSAWANGVATQTNRVTMTHFSNYVNSSGQFGSGQASAIVGNWAASAEL